jgi:uncharacterized protein
MSEPFIIDTHVHTGYPNWFHSPEVDARSLIARMDGLSILASMNLGSARNLLCASLAEMEKAQAEFEESGGRLYYCGYFSPHRGAEDMQIMEKAARGSGFVGIKIHPSFVRVPADDPRYAPVWQFASDRGLPIVTHTWSVSSYNPVQVLSLPEKFRPMVEKYPGVRFVMGHSGGRGDGRLQAISMARELPNAYMDISGDIMDRHFLEDMVSGGVERKILFGSDYPWLDQRAHLSCVYLARIPDETKAMILAGNARTVFRLKGH